MPATIRVYQDQFQLPNAARVLVFTDQLLIPPGASATSTVRVYTDALEVPRTARVRIISDYLEVPSSSAVIDADIYVAGAGGWRPRLLYRAAGSWVRADGSATTVGAEAVASGAALDPTVKMTVNTATAAGVAHNATVTV